MIPIISLLIVVSLSILITRIATIALTHTGLSKESARFQARSAFTGAGFTTQESEQVVNHPVRRRIVMFLMLLGNAGFVTALSSLVLTFVGNDSSGSLTLKLGALGMGLFLVTLLAMSSWVDRHLSFVIEWALARYTKLDVRDYASLMHLTGDYRLVELLIEHTHRFVNKTLAELQLREKGIVVLGVKRTDERYVGIPKGPYRMQPGDTAILYGRVSDLETLDSHSAEDETDEMGETAPPQKKSEESQ